MPARRAAGRHGCGFGSGCRFVPAAPAAALDTLKVAVAQRGQWDTAITELGQRSGILAKRGIAVEILYTQGGPEAHQAVISGSMDIACGGGIESAVGGYAKGAPVRIIGSDMIGSPDTYWFVQANSPIKSLRDAAGKTISYSQNGSSSHAALLSLLDQYKVDARPVSTGGHPATLTMTMTGQIDIGRGAAPFGLELVDEGKIRVIARGSEIKARSDQTVRVCLANAGVWRSAAMPSRASCRATATRSTGCIPIRQRCSPTRTSPTCGTSSWKRPATSISRNGPCGRTKSAASISCSPTASRTSSSRSRSPRTRSRK